MFGTLPILKWLLENKKNSLNIDAVMDKTGWTALHVAVEDSQVDTVKRLLDAGAKKDIQDTKGLTPLDVAKTMADALGSPDNLAIISALS